MSTNRLVVLKKRPNGLPAIDDFAVEERPIPALGDDQVLLEVSHISIDAFIRTTLSPEDGIHGTAQFDMPVTALGVGKVLQSTCAHLAEGDWAAGPTLAQTHALMPGGMFQKIDTSLAEPSAYLGLLGMTTGLTAYFGLHKLGAVKAGETVVVSGAAGAVGSVAGQMAKLDGATNVIGIAGGPAKSKYLTETLGLDNAIDYKNDDIGARLDELAPDGIDVYFDNVGGELLDTVLDRIRTGARVIICGAISQYDDLTNVRGPNLYLRLAERNSMMRGFTVDHFTQEFGEAVPQIVQWMGQGLILPEHIEEGIERFPEALIKLFTGGHMGKLLVKP